MSHICKLWVIICNLQKITDINDLQPWQMAADRGFSIFIISRPEYLAFPGTVPSRPVPSSGVVDISATSAIADGDLSCAVARDT